MKTLHDGVSRCDSSSSEPKEKERKKLKKKIMSRYALGKMSV